MKKLFLSLILLSGSLPLAAQNGSSRQEELEGQLKKQLEVRQKKFEQARQYQTSVAGLKQGPSLRLGAREYTVLSDYLVADPKGQKPSQPAILQTPWHWQVFKASDLGLDSKSVRIQKLDGTRYFPVLRQKNSALLLYASGKISVKGLKAPAAEALAHRLGLSVARHFPELSLTLVDVPPGQDLLTTLTQVRRENPEAELDLTPPPVGFE